jgi:hypothetical protein
VLALHVAYQAHRFGRMKATVEALFPSPRGAVDETRLLVGLAG